MVNVTIKEYFVLSDGSGDLRKAAGRKWMRLAEDRVIGRKGESPQSHI